MQRCKETKRAKQDGIKQARQAYNHTEWKRVCIEQTNIMKMCSHKGLHPNKPQEGWVQPKRQMVLKANKHKPTEGTKHGKSLDLVRQTWI